MPITSRTKIVLSWIFMVPRLQASIGLRGLLVVAGISAILGLATTAMLPEPAKTSLEDSSGQRA